MELVFPGPDEKDSEITEKLQDELVGHGVTPKPGFNVAME